MDKEKVDCNLCNQDNNTTIFVEREFPIVVCNTCGLCYVNPRITVDKYKKNLDVSYYELANENFTSRNHDEIKHARFRKYKAEEAKRYLKVAKKFFPTGKILDAGCSFGSFITHAAEENFQAYACEPSKVHKPDTKDITMLKKFYNKGFGELEGYDDFFDIITFWDTLEHVLNPKETLRAANRMLKRNGVIIIKVPNLAWLNLKFRLSKLLLKSNRFIMKRFYNNLGYFAPEVHLFNFSAQTIRRYLLETGFQPLKSFILETHGIQRPLTRLIKKILSLIIQPLYCISFGQLNYNISLCIAARKI